jgi:NTE family protein
MPDETRSSSSPRSHQAVALVLQGGGALGAYQAGVYEALAGTEYLPDWIAGVSIGAINGALIAGNPPERRVERLSEFWHLVSSGGALLPDALLEPWMEATTEGHATRAAFNLLSAGWSALLGVTGFYRPRIPPPWLQPDGTPGALSFYDPTPLRRTLERLVDFELINRKAVRLSMGATDVRTGASVYFDNHERRIGPEHVLASAALPPAFPPVSIDGEAYWDGGLVSNTPLQQVLDARPAQSLLAFQVDLFRAAGELPTSLRGVLSRQLDIQYASRTRAGSARAAERSRATQALGAQLAALPERLRSEAALRELLEGLRTPATDVVHLAYRTQTSELESRENEFSRRSMLEHWQAGEHDLRATLADPRWRQVLDGEGGQGGFAEHDLLDPAAAAPR